MGYHRTSAATEPVRRYLLQMIAKSGPEPERLMAERELAEKLHLSRVTVRRAIKELEDSYHIIRIPGRKGAFTNPDISSNVEQAIGIVLHQSYIGQVFSQFLSGISEELCMQGHHFCFTPFFADGRSPSELLFELKNSGFDSIVWHLQGPEDIKAINLLLKDHFPVLTICNPDHPEWGHPDSGWYGFDTMDAGRASALYFLREQCRNIICCSRTNALVPGFRAELEEHGMLLPDEKILHSEQDFIQKLPALLESGADGLFCQLNEPMTTQLLNYLSTQEAGTRLKILLPPWPVFEHFKRQYPKLQINLPDSFYYQQQCIALGRDIAHGIMGGHDSCTGLMRKAYSFAKRKNAGKEK